MKKITLLFAAILATTSFVSCIGDDNNSTATVHYTSMVDSIQYSNPADTVWTLNIKQALQKMEVLYTTFNVSDTAVSSIQDYAVQGCNQKAGKILDDKLKKVTLSDIKKNIYSLHADSLNKLGYVGSEALPLNKFTLHSSLWSLYTGKEVFYYKNTIQ